ncbi:MAG: alpha/beta fold hydrolase, partial [Polyangiaceae bacterium]
AASVIEPATQTTSVGPQKIHAGDLDFLEVLTPGARETDTLPMIVAVHGMGDRPENWLDFFVTFPVPARVYFPRAPEPYGDGSSWFTYPPKSAEDLAAGIAKAGDRVAAAIAELAKTKTRGKPILMGFSQGGFVSFDVAVHHPEVIDAAFPMSGGLPDALFPHTEEEARLTAPIFATHGTADRMVPIAMSRDAIAKIVSLGGRAVLKEYPGAAHTITPAMHEEISRQIAERLRSKEASGDGG